MVQSGRPEEWWDCALECECYFENVYDKMADGKTAYSETCGVTFDGHLIPLGANVSDKPISPKDESRLHQVGQKMPLAILMGYVLRAGRGWSGSLAFTVEPLGETTRKTKIKKGRNHLQRGVRTPPLVHNEAHRSNQKKKHSLLQ